MRQFVFIFLAISCFFTLPAFAAFPVHPKDNGKVTINEIHKQLVENSTAVQNRVLAPDNKKAADGGGMGIASFVLSLVGLFVAAVICGTLAVIFGVIGMKPGKAHHGLAVAGFIIGVIDVVAGLILLSRASS